MIMEGSKKKLLFIYSHIPWPIKMGIDARVINLLNSLSKKFEVDLVCKVRSKDKLKNISEIKKYCRNVEVLLSPNCKSNLHRLGYKVLFFLSFLFKGTPFNLFYNNLSEIKKKILNLVRDNHYDIIFFEYWYWEKKLIQACNGLKVVDTNDVQFIRESRTSERKNVNSLLTPFIRFQMKRYMKRELKQLNLFDLIITITEDDKKTFHEYLGPQKEIIVFPTGADTDYFLPREVEPEEELLIFYGNMTSFINTDGVLYLYKEIMPLIWNKRKNAKLMVLGSNPSEEVVMLTSDPRVTVTGYVEDVRDYLAKGKVVILPLRFVYGHRGRLFEIMAMGIPSVVTPQAIAGMELKNGDGLLIEESPHAIAQAVLMILEKQIYAEELRMKARKIAIERFSNQATYNRLTDSLLEYTKRMEMRSNEIPLRG